MNKDYTPIIYLLLGILFSIIFGFIVFVALMAKSTPLPQTYIILAMAVMAFSLSYLYPHLKRKDERANMTRQKGMFYSFLR